MNTHCKSNLKSYLNVSALAVSMIVGTGVFSLTGIALDAGGATGSLLGWLVASLAILPFLLLFHNLEESKVFQGGLISCVQSQFGEKLARGVQCVLLVTYLFVVPVVVYVGSSYLQKSFFLPDRVMPVFSVALLTVATGINWLGKKSLDRINHWSWLVLAGILLSTVLWHQEHFHSGFALLTKVNAHTQGITFESVWETVALVFFAFIGWENLVILQTQKEERGATWPIYVISYVFVISLYFGLALVTSGASLTHPEVGGVSGFLELLRALPCWPIFIAGAVLVVLSNVTSWMFGAAQLFSKILLKPNGVTEGTEFNVRSAFLPLYVIFTFVFSLLTSEILSVANLVNVVNKNFLFLYLLILVIFWRTSKGSSKWVLTSLALVSSLFFLDDISKEVLFSLSLFLVGWLWSLVRPSACLAHDT